MIVVAFTSIVALFLGYLDARKVLKNGMLLGFIIITVLGCIHYDYGNDYMQYYYEYQIITDSEFNFSYVFDKTTFRDPGWSLLCFIFKHIGGFYTMVATLTIIQNALVYNFIRNSVDRKYWSISVFVFLFTSSFFLLGLSMLRQWFVMCVFVGIWSLINGKKWFLSLAIIYLCSFVHRTAFILLPFAFWGFIPYKGTKKYSVILLILFCCFWLSKNLLNSIFSQLLALNTFNSYSDSYDDESALQSVGVGYLLKIMPFFISIYYLNNKSSLEDETEKTKFKLVLLASIAYLVTPFSQIIQMISRVRLYFSLLNVAAIPIVYGAVSNKLIRYMLYGIYVFMTLYEYWMFFHSETYGKSYQTFKTIFLQF